MNRKLPRPLRGVITAMVTPLGEDLTLDEKGLEQLIEHLIGGGVHGLFILGTTGEAPNLPYNVRSALIEQTCKLSGLSRAGDRRHHRHLLPGCSAHGGKVL